MEHPDMVTLEARLKSFERWKKSSKCNATKRDFAEAGFYYVGDGYDDCVRCFFCNGGLKNWEYWDEPWIEHACYFPECTYLLLVKGPMFVDIVQKRNKNKQQLYLELVEKIIRLIMVNGSDDGHQCCLCSGTDVRRGEKKCAYKKRERSESV